MKPAKTPARKAALESLRHAVNLKHDRVKSAEKNLGVFGCNVVFRQGNTVHTYSLANTAVRELAQKSLEQAEAEYQTIFQTYLKALDA